MGRDGTGRDGTGRTEQDGRTDEREKKILVHMHACADSDGRLDPRDTHKYHCEASGHRQVFQRFAVADGSGDFSKPFKMEWATVK